ncbi:hypothetical protein [Albidovulum sp.]|uniref:hypothetical protein n=1 Tax=Albidovulum sp. TaxID=1872424 RepID=UPI0039B8F00E
MVNISIIETFRDMAARFSRNVSPQAFRGLCPAAPRGAARRAPDAGHDAPTRTGPSSTGPSRKILEIRGEGGDDRRKEGEVPRAICRATAARTAGTGQAGDLPRHDRQAIRRLKHRNDQKTNGGRHD